MDSTLIAKDLFILMNKLKRLLDKRQQNIGLHSGQARILRYLYRNRDEKTYQKDIESAFQIRGGTVTGMTDSLVKNGYIKRVESESDKRKRKIVLTDMGEEVALKGIEITNDLEKSLYELLTEEERIQFMSILEKIDIWIDEEESK